MVFSDDYDDERRVDIIKTDKNIHSGIFEYLCVDDFLRDAVTSRVLGTAFETGMIDFLEKNRPCNKEIMENRFKDMDEKALDLILNILKAARIVEEKDGDIILTGRFTEALKYRDLMESKLRFANFLSRDFTDLFTPLMVDPGFFAENARLFHMFGYNRCFEKTEQNIELTRRWVQVTTALTTYESGICMAYHDFSPYTRILDIGGNSGEFGLRICRKYPGARVTIFDLPLVCDLGREHTKNEPEAERLSFARGNGLIDPLPNGFDLITFKSMLHDWPEREARRFIERAVQSLKPGGTLLIFERETLDFQDGIPPFSMIPFLLFFRSFRSSALYENHLRESGLREVHTKHIRLETSFHLITGKKVQ